MSPPNLSAESSAVSAASETNSAEHTLLIVDDSAMDRRLAGAIVEKIDGWRTLFASDGKEALETLKHQTPDVVLTDMLMPEMDGLELVRAIGLKHSLVPVILMTAHGSEDLAIQALRNGAASYVPKKCLAPIWPTLSTACWPPARAIAASGSSSIVWSTTKRIIAWTMTLPSSRRWSVISNISWSAHAHL